MVYHATVVAPETFVIDDDVNELKKHLGKISVSEEGGGGVSLEVIFSIFTYNVLMYGKTLPFIFF